VLELETKLTPHDLLKKLLDIETAMGRVRSRKWEPRIIDIDILFYRDEIITGNLNIPHPLLHVRRFTLIPLNEIASSFVHPVLHKTISQLLAECPDNSIVEIK
jgi:2-amino-4-hydroxy-6-hydroxymethyldihydropteridine diphosphokinase